MCVCVCLSLSLFLAFSFFLSCILPACLRSGVRVSPDTFVLLRVCVGCAAVAALPGLQSLQLSHLFELTDDNMAYVCQSCRQLKHLAVKVRARLAVSTDGWTHAHTHTNAHTHTYTWAVLSLILPVHVRIRNRTRVTPSFLLELRLLVP